MDWTNLASKQVFPPQKYTKITYPTWWFHFFFLKIIPIWGRWSQFVMNIFFKVGLVPTTQTSNSIPSQPSLKRVDWCVFRTSPPWVGYPWWPSSCPRFRRFGSTPQWRRYLEGRKGIGMTSFSERYTLKTGEAVGGEAWRFRWTLTLKSPGLFRIYIYIYIYILIYMGDEILPCYVGTIISYYKDPY